MPKLRKLSREQRKFIIRALVRESPTPLRIIQIARAMNVTRSPYLCELLDEMVYDGYLDVVTVEVAPDLPARAYCLPAAPHVIRSTPIPLDSSA